MAADARGVGADQQLLAVVGVSEMWAHFRNVPGRAKPDKTVSEWVREQRGEARAITKRAVPGFAIFAGYLACCAQHR